MKQPQYTEHDVEALLGAVKNSTHAMREIDRLELAGRACILMLSGHMNYACSTQSPAEYFLKSYDDAIVEFIQLDDYDFCLHHASRTLFYRWQEELASFSNSWLGQLLANSAGPILAPTKPTRERRRATAEYWYEGVRDALARGEIPPPHGHHRAEMMKPEECRAAELSTQRVWFGLLHALCEIWAEQVALMWTCMREAIELSNLAQRWSEDRARKALDEYSSAVKQALDQWKAVYTTWHQRHSTSVDLHDPFFRKYLSGVEEWWSSHPNFQGWFITEGTKDEIYMEIAAGIAQLKGKPYDVKLPEFTYWRKAPWNPACLREGLPGLPPFNSRTGDAG